MSNQQPVYDLDVTVESIDFEREPTIEEVAESKEYISNGRWLSDLIIQAKASTMTGIKSTVCVVPCDGWCHDNQKATEVLSNVGIDKAKTRGLHLDHIDKAVKTSCRACADRYFKMADVLSYHLDLLECRERRDDAGATRAAARRGELLRQLGFKRA